MAMFAQLSAYEIEIDLNSNLMTPERLYLAARVLATPHEVRSMDYHLDRDTLETIPWLTNWRRMKSIILVRSEGNDHTLGSFAQIKSFITI